MHKKEKQYHQILAEYFTEQSLFLDDDLAKPNARKCTEQVYQQIKSEMWDEVTETLCDLLFMDSKVKSRFVDDLQNDYTTSLEHIPENKKGCLETVSQEFLKQIHVLRQWPELTFQQMYNELQWREGLVNEFAEKSRYGYLQKKGVFLHQYRKPIVAASKLVMTLTGHKYPVNACSFSPDAKKIVSGEGFYSDDFNKHYELIVWDVTTGKILLCLAGHKDVITSCSFSPDGNKIISGSWDKTIRVWDSCTGNELIELKGHSDHIHSCGFFDQGSKIYSSSEDGTIKIWDTQTGTVLNTFSNPGYFKSCAVSPDGKTIVAGRNIWDIETGKIHLKLDGHADMHVKSCAYSSDGKMIVSSDEYDGCIIISDAKTGKKLIELDGHNCGVNCCSFSPDCTRILSGAGFPDMTIRVWDVETGRNISTFKGHGGGVNSCSYQSDGNKVVSGGADGNLKIWDIHNEKESTSFSGHGSYIRSCIISPNNKIIVSSSLDNSIKSWVLKNGNNITTLLKSAGENYHVKCYGFSPDNNRLIVDDSGKIKILDLKKGEEILVINTPNRSFCSYSHDGNRIFLGGQNGTIEIRDALNGKLLHILDHHTGKVTQYNFSPDGRLFVSAGNNGKIIIWDAETGCELLKLKGFSYDITACKFSPDGKKIFAGGEKPFGQGSYSTLKIWDLQTGEQLYKFSDHNDSVRACDFSPDGRLVWSECFGNIKLWDIKTGKKILCKNNIKSRNYIDYIDNSSVIIGTNLMKLVNVNTGTELCSYFVDGGPMVNTLSKCCTTIVCGDSFGNLYLYKPVGFLFGRQVVTGARLWHFGDNCKPGSPSPDFTAVCPCCGDRFAVPALILGAIADTNKKYNIGPDNSPCSKLPREAWADPALLTECPSCKKPLKFNPFVVDNQASSTS